MPNAEAPTSQSYTPYKNLPPLCGLCSMEEAARPGLSVDACVSRHKRHHFALRRLEEILVSRLTAEPIYELKMAFSHHAHLCAEHVTSLRTRVGEMREPPLGLKKVPHPALKLFFEEIEAAPTTETLLLGLYEEALPALIRGLKRHTADTNPLADAPSVRIIRFALLELEEMLDYGKKAIECLVDKRARGDAADYLKLLGNCLAAAGDLDGVDEPVDFELEPIHSKQPPKFDPVPRRDERFPDPYNMGVHAEEFLYDDSMPADPKVLMMLYKRLREIDVPEMMASILAQTPGKPWNYYRDMVRQLWDEARHAMMGEVGFVALGVDWKKVLINFTWSLTLNTKLKPWERHSVLYFIEQGLMPKTGKRYEWEVGLESSHSISATFQDFDWADEVLHAKIGRDWYVAEFENAKEAVAYGDACWSKVLLDWEAWKREGKTEHRNWWPDLYRDYCRATGQEPDPKVLAYNRTYQTSRADLKEMLVSG